MIHTETYAGTGLSPHPLDEILRRLNPDMMIVRPINPAVMESILRNELGDDRWENEGGALVQD